MKIHDQHVHSYYSFDCQQPIEEYLVMATELGLRYFVLTDHIDFNFLDQGRDLNFDIQKQREELSRLQKRYEHLQILQGVELGYKPSELKRMKELINQHDFDLINLSLHESDGIDYFYPESFIELGIKRTLTIYFQRLLEMVQNFDDFDVLCHLGYGFKTAYALDHSIRINEYEEVIKEIMRTLISKDKTLEVNTKVAEVLPIEHTKYLLKLYHDLGGKNLTLSSDAHHVNRFRSHFDEYLPVIKDAGFTYLIYFVGREKFKAFI